MLEEARLRSDASRTYSKTLDFDATLIENAIEETVEEPAKHLRNHWGRSYWARVVLARACNARVRASIYIYL